MAWHRVNALSVAELALSVDFGHNNKLIIAIAAIYVRMMTLNASLASRLRNNNRSQLRY